MEFYPANKLRVIGIDLQNVWQGGAVDVMCRQLSLWHAARANDYKRLLTVHCNDGLSGRSTDGHDTFDPSTIHGHWPLQPFRVAEMPAIARGKNIPTRFDLVDGFRELGDEECCGKVDIGALDSDTIHDMTADDDTHFIFGSAYEKCATTAALGSKHRKPNRTVIFVRDLCHPSGPHIDTDAVDAQLRAAGVIVVDSHQLTFGPDGITVRSDASPHVALRNRLEAVYD